MVKINVIGGGFQHDVCSSAWNKNTHVEWVKDNSSNISIHIDNSIFEDIGLNKEKLRFAWFAESSAIIPNVIEKAKKNIEILEDNYELLFTHDLRLLPLSTKFRFVIPNAMPWVLKENRKIHNKTKNISMVASTKSMCDGHRYRHRWVNRLRAEVDIFGSGQPRFANRKEDAMIDYMFSVAMENDNYENIFTEKITDCFATGTIPIFYGTPKIGEFFNEKGIIMLDEEFNPQDMTEELYQSKMDYIVENFERSLELPSAEDFMYLNYIK